MEKNAKIEAQIIKQKALRHGRACIFKQALPAKHKNYGRT